MIDQLKPVLANWRTRKRRFTHRKETSQTILNKWLTCFILLSTLGINGCQTQTSDDPEDRREAKQDEFTSKPPKTFPADEGTSISFVKPGHWFTVGQEIRSNKADLRGTLETKLTVRSSSVLNPDSQEDARPVKPVESNRPVVMPKGQTRTFDSRGFVPAWASGSSSTAIIQSELAAVASATFFQPPGGAANLMSSSEYLMVVLTRRPERFNRFRNADWVRDFQETYSTEDPIQHYRVVIPEADDLLALPESMLDLTHTAVIVWDDLPVDFLTSNQRKAIVDWLHFGGRLIVNGLSGSQSLDQSTLQEFLPIQNIRAIEGDKEPLVKLIESQSVKTDPSIEKIISTVSSQPLVYVDGSNNSSAYAVDDSGALVWQKPAGRGWTVQSRFDLMLSSMSEWKSYDSFINSMILARPPREFYNDSRTNARQIKLDGSINRVGISGINTPLRLFSRDAQLAGFSRTNNSSNGSLDVGFRSDALAGVASFGSHSEWFRYVRNELLSASGIEVPSRSLVAKLLLVYLVILVPINYIVFRVLGRLEWAWLAVPVMALVGSVLIARATRLDIGFATRLTEIQLLEMPAGFSRAHCTQVAAIYNSLSDTYDITFHSPDGCGFVDEDSDTEESRPTRIQTAVAAGPKIGDVTVASNNTQVLHLERLVDLGGTVSLRDGNVFNDTDLNLNDLTIVSGKPIANADESQDELKEPLSPLKIIGNVPSGASVPIDGNAAATSSPEEESDAVLKGADLHRSLLSRWRPPPGAQYAIAWTSDELNETISIEPSPAATVRVTLLVLALKHAPSMSVRPDLNLISDLKAPIDVFEDE
ncbi:MAG: hypothetical protein AAF664_00245 [Planctomycetota bacterium]